MKAKRTQGTIGEMDTKPSGALWEQAKAILAKKAEAKVERQAKRDAEPVPNWRCYPEAFPPHLYDPKTGRWRGGRLPKCRVCECTLQPTENHKCDGFKPKYVEHDQDWHDKQDARREEIRKSRPRTYDDDGEPIVMCDVCGERMYDPEDAHRHYEDHGGKPEDTRHTRDGEPDGDLDGYDDEPEEDYCEGDDDGWDCD